MGFQSLFNASYITHRQSPSGTISNLIQHHQALSFINHWVHTQFIQFHNIHYSSATEPLMSTIVPVPWPSGRSHWRNLSSADCDLGQSGDLGKTRSKSSGGGWSSTLARSSTRTGHLTTFETHILILFWWLLLCWYFFEKCVLTD